MTTDPKLTTAVEQATIKRIEQITDEALRELKKLKEQADAQSS